MYKKKRGKELDFNLYVKLMFNNDTSTGNIHYISHTQYIVGIMYYISL